MAGRRGLIMGVANDHSIAWGIAQQLHKAGAELAFTYQGEAFGRRVKPLAESVGSSILVPCDVEDVSTVDSAFDTLKEKWGTIDFVVHALAFSDKNELKGKYADTTRENFIRTMVISCFSFTEIAKRAAALMPNGGSLLTLTYGGSVRVMPNYNVMGVAKAALESLAENTSDGIVAPILWYALLGLPGIVVYKAINTADSMIGHKSEKYLSFGWAAARLDDVVNLPASRLTGLLFAAARPSQFSSVVNIMRRDAPKHQSPNAGWPEAAMAGGLGLSLAGLAWLNRWAAGRQGDRAGT